MSGTGPRRYRVLVASGLLLLAVGAGWAVRTVLVVEASASLANSQDVEHPSSGPFHDPATLGNDIELARVEPAEARSSGRHPVTIRRPAGPPRVDLGMTDASGKPLTAACSTCHATRPANTNNKTPADLNEFHQNLAFAHGTVSCLSCHNPNDYDSLHLADGSPVAYIDVMTLCAQCHGPQTRDFEHGAHGGMTGYWDLSKGPRVRNNCVDCHAPHTPGFPAMQPTFKPRDRFLEHKKHAE